MPIGGGGTTYTYRLATLAILEETVLEVHDDIVAGTVYEVDPWNGSIWFEWEAGTVDVYYDTLSPIGGEGGSKYGITWLQGEPPKLFPWIGHFKLQKIEEET